MSYHEPNVILPWSCAKTFFSPNVGEKDLDDAREKDPSKRLLLAQPPGLTTADNDNTLFLSILTITTVNLTPPRPKPMTALPTGEASRLFPPTPEPWITPDPSVTTIATTDKRSLGLYRNEEKTATAPTVVIILISSISSRMIYRSHEKQHVSINPSKNETAAVGRAPILYRSLSSNRDCSSEYYSHATEDDTKVETIRVREWPRYQRWGDDRMNGLGNGNSLGNLRSVRIGKKECNYLEGHKTTTRHNFWHGYRSNISPRCHSIFSVKEEWLV